MSKRILIVSDCPTHPVVGGNRQCMLQYAEILRTIGYDLYFLFVRVDEIPEKELVEMREYWGNHYFQYYTPKLQYLYQKIRRKIERRYFFDKVDVYYPWGLTSFVNKLHSEYHFYGMIVNYIWLSKLAESIVPRKTIFTHDVFANRNNRPGCYWMSFTQEEEAKAISRFKEVLSIQDEETDYYRSIAPQSHVRTVYSSFRFVEQKVNGNKNILFFSGAGSLNLDGIKRFIDDVFPQLIKRDPEVYLLLGGNICSLLETTQLHPNIILKGRYENPDDFYALGDICINPVFSGSGLKIKTLEALAHGKLTIVDPHSALGIYRADNVPLLRAKTEEEYVDYILGYLQNIEKLELNRKACCVYISDLNNYIINQYRETFID